MLATPIAYLIDEHGVTIHDVAVGIDAIQSPLNSCLAAAIADPMLVNDHELPITN